MKNLLLLFTIILLFTGCIKVEDGTDTDTEDTTSSVTIESKKNNFTILWKKNTEEYGQLEISQDTNISNPISSAIGKKEILLNCDFIAKNTNKSLEDFECYLQNSSSVGTFILTMPIEQELLIIEREGELVEDAFIVLSDFLLHPSSPLENEEASQEEVKDYTILTKKSPEEANENCKFGGTKLETGLDENENNILDNSEITNTEFVCDSNEILIKTANEEDGVNCEFGGTKVELGLDRNQNNTLEQEEVSKSTFVCKTSDEIDLMNTYTEPSGENCVLFGIKVVSGIDINENKVLDEHEIINTTYVCSN